MKGIKIFLNKRQTKNRKNRRGRYKSLLEDKRQRLVKYRKSYSKIWENRTASQINTG